MNKSTLNEMGELKSVSSWEDQVLIVSTFFCYGVWTLKKNYNNALIDWKVSELTFNRLKKFFFEIADKSQKLQI